MRNFAKTKILATIGPSADSERMLGKLIDAGIDAFRLNFSHGSHEYFEELFERICIVREKKHAHISVLVDLQGPKIRIGNLSKPEIQLKKGKEIEIAGGTAPGNEKRITSQYKPPINDAQQGDNILFDDGFLHL